MNINPKFRQICAREYPNACEMYAPPLTIVDPGVDPMTAQDWNAGFVYPGPDGTN